MSDESGGHGHPAPETLSRIAGDGAGAAPDAVRDHVRACRDCRREVEGIRRVLRAAGTLPDAIPPARDLWSGVEARIRGEEPGPAPRRERDGRALRSVAPWLAAAAAVLVAATAGATIWLYGTGGTGGRTDAGGPDVGAPARVAGVLPASVRSVRSAYVPMAERLGELADRRGDRLPPEARRVLERNRRIIDAAIAEAEAALAERPSSSTLLRALDRTYERKIELLRRSARLAARL